VRTTALDEVVEYDPENLTLSAGAGAGLARLTSLVARDGLVFPLDPPASDHATLGGVLATNDQGPRRLLRGGVRDVVLGMKAVLAGGERIKSGGRTIKNVTGYDITRLFVGSMGSLGVVSEVTVRLLPRPASEQVVLVPTPGLAEAAALVAALLRSQLVPSTLTLLSPVAVRAILPEDLQPEGIPHGGPVGPLLLVGFEGHPAAVARQVHDVLEAAGRPSTARVTPDGRAESVWSALASVRVAARAAGLPVEAKAAVPLSGLAAVLREIEEGSGANARDGAGAFWWADAGSGTAAVRLDSGREGPTDTVAGLHRLRELAVRQGGSLVVTDGAAALAGEVDAWGAPPAGLKVMTALKDRFDPQGLLNPGRSPGGL
jgi:glycolate oxidase